MTEIQEDPTQVNLPPPPRWQDHRNDTVGVISIDINEEISTQHQPTLADTVECQFNAIKLERGSPLPCWCRWIPYFERLLIRSYFCSIFFGLLFYLPIIFSLFVFSITQIPVTIVYNIIIRILCCNYCNEYGICAPDNKYKLSQNELKSQQQQQQQLDVSIDDTNDQKNVMHMMNRENYKYGHNTSGGQSASAWASTDGTQVMHTIVTPRGKPVVSRTATAMNTIGSIDDMTPEPVGNRYDDKDDNYKLKFKVNAADNVELKVKSGDDDSSYSSGGSSIKYKYDDSTNTTQMKLPSIDRKSRKKINVNTNWNAITSTSIATSCASPTAISTAGTGNGNVFVGNSNRVNGNDNDNDNDYGYETFTVLQCNLCCYFGAGWTRYCLISETFNKYKADIICIEEAITSYITPISTINIINKTTANDIIIPNIESQQQQQQPLTMNNDDNDNGTTGVQNGSNESKNACNVSSSNNINSNMNEFCEYDTFFKSTLDSIRRVLPYLTDSPVWSFLSETTCVLSSIFAIPTFRTWFWQFAFRSPFFISVLFYLLTQFIFHVGNLISFKNCLCYYKECIQLMPGLSMFIFKFVYNIIYFYYHNTYFNLYLYDNT